MKIKLVSGDCLNISESNSKVGDIWSVSLSPVVTCKKDVPCSKFCYACKVQNFRKNVKKSWQENTETISNTKNIDDIVKKLSALINALDIKYFRWNVSGDFKLYRYFEVACKVAENCPNTKFLAFTKCFELAYCDRPKNFTLILSAWNDYQPTEKQAERSGIAYYCDGSRPMPEHAEICSGKCNECFRCFSLRPGQAVIFKKH